jgi:hypothetical protein
VFWAARLRLQVPQDGLEVIPAGFGLGSYPSLARAVGAGIFEDGAGPEEDFAFGLDRVLDGVEALIQRSSPRPVPPSLPRTSSK